MSARWVKATLVVLATEAVVLLVAGLVTGRWRFVVEFAVLVGSLVVDQAIVRKDPDAGRSFRIVLVAVAIAMAPHTVDQAVVLGEWLRAN